MSRPSCSTCGDLRHETFASGSYFDYPQKYEGSSLARYRAIKFPALRASAKAGCHNCMVLEGGIRLFWGSNPAIKYGRRKTEKQALVLKSEEGKGLIAFRDYEFHPFTNSGRGMQIEFFSDRECHPIFGHAHHVPRQSSVAAAAQALKSWLSSCEETHESCKAFPVKLPSRALDISSEVPKLVEFQDEEAPYGRYATMSHCWGDSETSKPTMTTRENLEQRKAGIALADISPLFQDAIRLCHAGGCSYLWIDSLCIIQGDSLDWEIQSQKMAQIYSNAHFNIAATLAPNSSQSLFEDRWSHGSNDERYPVQTYNVEMPSASDCPVFVRLAHYRDHIYVQKRMPNLCSSQAPLMYRAWVLQEILLARRTLHVCASELIWECRTIHACECGSIASHVRETPAIVRAQRIGELQQGLPPAKQDFSRVLESRCTPQEARDFWLRVSQEYSHLELSIKSDRTAAFSGLIDAVAQVTNGIFIAGIWTEDLPRALLWLALPINDPESSRSSIAPTWSWMSRCNPGYNCSMTYYGLYRGGFRDQINTSVSILGNPGQNLTSEESRHVLRFCGPAFSACLCELDSGIAYDFRHFVIKPDLHPGQPDWEAFAMEADCIMSPEDSLQDGTAVDCLLLGSSDDATYKYVLVVKKCRLRGEDFYRRVGIAEAWVGTEARDYFGNAKVKTINIVLYM